MTEVQHHAEERATIGEGKKEPLLGCGKISDGPQYGSANETEDPGGAHCQSPQGIGAVGTAKDECAFFGHYGRGKEYRQQADRGGYIGGVCPVIHAPPEHGLGIVFAGGHGCRKNITALLYSVRGQRASTLVPIPPRGRKSPVTTAHLGRAAFTTSSSTWFTMFS